jgi:hypothetical protein
MTEEKAARNTAYAQAFLNIVGASLSIKIWTGLPRFPLLYWQMATIGAGVFSLVATQLFRQKWTEKLGNIIFSINLLPMFGMLWTATSLLATAEKFWIPFRAYQLSTIAIAIMAPSKAWAGLFGIVTLTVLALIQYFNFTPGQLVWMARGEPWGTIAYCMFSGILYWYRLRGKKIERELAADVEKNSMTRKLARTLLAVQDLANSPVQSLINDAEILRTKFPETKDIAQRIQRCSQKLRELNILLTTQANELTQEAGDESFDAKGVLEDINK